MRLAGQVDLHRVRAIARDAYAAYVPRLGFEPPPMVADFASAIADGTVWVDEALLGYVVVRRETARVLLENVAVDPVAKGTGLGRRLIEHAEAIARREKLPIELYTNVAMTENLTLYPRLGYREFARRTEDGLHRVYFRKTFG